MLVNNIGTFQGEGVMHARTNVTCKPRQIVIQLLYHLESKVV